jgi:outer membrane protein OmpA-like peptidoglycan-associated protein
LQRGSTTPRGALWDWRRSNESQPARPRAPFAASGNRAPRRGAATPVLSDQQIQEGLKGGAAHATTRGLRRQSSSAPSGSINLNIAFEYNSFALKPEASEQLRQLTSALTSDTLRADRFMVAGHTDAKGNPQFNKHLSLQRAESVKRYLVASGVDGSRLVAVGYGAEQLLDPDQPNDARNRRVEIRDLGAAP